MLLDKPVEAHSVPIRVQTEAHRRRSATVTHHRAQLLALVRSVPAPELPTAHPEAF